MTPMKFVSFRTQKQADDYAACLDQNKVKWLDVEQDIDGSWVVMFQER